MKIPQWVKIKRFFIPTVIILIIVIIMVAKKPDDAEVLQQELKQVEVLDIQKTDQFQTEVSLKGTVIPREFVRLKSLVSADLQFIAPVGATLKRGDLVARLVDTRIEDSYFNASEGVNEAQGNLLQTQALNQESITQAELALSSANSALDLARSSHANSQDLTYQDLKASQNTAEITYQASYNLAEQVLRFWSDGSLADFILEDAIVANFDLHQTTNQEFEFVVDDFETVSVLPGENLALALATLEPVLERTKNFNDLVFRVTSFMVSGSNYTETDIDTLKAQAISYTTLLNAQNTALKNSLIALETVEVTSRGSLQIAENQFKQAQIQYDNALAALESAKRQSEIRDLGARSQVTGSRSQLAAAQGQFEDLSLRAPFNGVVITHNASVGDQISPGQPVLELGDISGVEIELAIDERSGSLIQTGQEVLINDGVVGIIEELSPSASIDTGKVSLKVVAESNEQLIPGDIAEVKIRLTYTLADVIIIPLAYVTVAQNENFVLVIEEGKVTKRVITLNQIRDSHVEVSEGLEEGDLVIVTNGEFLSLGEEVEIKEN